MRHLWKIGLLGIVGLIGLVHASFAQTATPTNTPISLIPTPIANQGAEVIAFTAITARMKFQNTGGTVQLLVRNKTTDACSVVVTSVAEPSLGRTGDVTLVIPTATAGTAGIGVLGPFSPAGFNRKTPANELGWVVVTSTGCTGADIAVIRHQ